MTDVKWTGPRDDKTARIDGYVLRAAMLKKGLWWWGVGYLTEEDVLNADISREPFPTTGKGAMQAAEWAMKKHSDKRTGNDLIY